MAEEPVSGAPEHDKAVREGSPDISSSPPLEAEGGDSKTLAPPDSSSQPDGDGGSAGDGRSFSQLLAGAMASAAAGVSTGAASFLTVPVITIPCYIAPAVGLTVCVSDRRSFFRIFLSFPKFFGFNFVPFLYIIL